jgi:hypothetical protein
LGEVEVVVKACRSGNSCLHDTFRKRFDNYDSMLTETVNGIIDVLEQDRLFSESMGVDFLWDDADSTSEYPFDPIT